jgi:sulfur carrier protein ThiS
MLIYLGGHLNFYHPQKEKWLKVELAHQTPLLDILTNGGIPLGEVHMVVINGEVVELRKAIISNDDTVKIFSAVGGG